MTGQFQHGALKMSRLVLGFVIIPLLLSSCGPDAPSTQDQLDLVVTSYQPSFRFDQASTYYLPNQIVVIEDPGTTTEPVDPALSQHVLQTIAAQLNARGYTQLPAGSTTPPSIFVEVSEMETEVTQEYYGYWYSYYGGYYAPFYGSAYAVGWAPVPTAYVTSSTLGSLILNVTDPNHPDTASKTIPTVWAAVLNGVIDNSTQDQIQQRIDTGIEQAFAQSPYFTRSTP
jgi:hypothetical protein